jgi:lysophospholipase L1-like esterase
MEPVSAIQLQYGDPTIWTRSVGLRPQKCLWLADSIATDWSPTFYGLLPKLWGMDGNLARGQGQDISPPSSPGTFCASYDIYLPTSTSGGGTLHANVSSGATSIQVDMASLNNGTWGPSMIVTITDGTNTDTIKLANSAVDGTLQSGPNNPTTISFTTATPSSLSHAYLAANTTVTWHRPSNVGHYWWGRNTEFVFAAAASPAPPNWGFYRLCDWYLTEAASGLSEDTYKQVRGWANGPIRGTLYYLATPKATNVNNVQLNGYVSGTGTVTPVPFSTYAATPTIKSVSITFPTPTAYTATTGVRFTVQASGTGTFAAGDVFCPIAMYVERTDATDGYGMFFAGSAGTAIWNYSADGLYTDGSTYRPVFMSAAFASAFVTLAGIDTLIVNLGHNVVAPDAATAEVGYRSIINNVRAGNASLRTILITNYATPGAYSSQELITQTAMQAVAGDPGVLTLDLFALMNNPTYNNAILADGTHPNATGDQVFSAAVLGLLDGGPPSWPDLRKLAGFYR